MWEKKVKKIDIYIEFAEYYYFFNLKLSKKDIFNIG